MSTRTVGGAAAAYFGYKIIKHLTTTEHHNILKSTYNEVDRYSNSDSTLKVDHISPWGHDGRPETVNGHRPDLVLRGFDSPNLIVEVETAESLDATARAQLTAFKKSGYKRVLVIPEEATSQAKGFVSSLEGEVMVSSPAGLGEYLR